MNTSNPGTGNSSPPTTHSGWMVPLILAISVVRPGLGLNHSSGLFSFHSAFRLTNDWSRKLFPHQPLARSGRQGEPKELMGFQLSQDSMADLWSPADAGTPLDHQSIVKQPDSSAAHILTPSNSSPLMNNSVHGFQPKNWKLFSSIQWSLRQLLHYEHSAVSKEKKTPDDHHLEHCLDAVESMTIIIIIIIIIENIIAIIVGVFA